MDLENNEKGKNEQEENCVSASERGWILVTFLCIIYVHILHTYENAKNIYIEKDGIY
jgi:hypothetical protein